jgi:hypothetical protein
MHKLPGLPGPRNRTLFSSVRDKQTNWDNIAGGYWTYASRDVILSTPDPTTLTNRALFNAMVRVYYDNYGTEYYSSKLKPSPNPNEPNYDCQDPIEYDHAWSDPAVQRFLSPLPA